VTILGAFLKLVRLNPVLNSLAINLCTSAAFGMVLSPQHQRDTPSFTTVDARCLFVADEFELGCDSAAPGDHLIRRQLCKLVKIHVESC